MKNKVYDCLIENFSYENFYLKDVFIEQPNGIFKTVKKKFDLVVLNLKRIIFFIQLNNGISNSDAVVLLRSSLNFMANRLSLSLNDFIVCGLNENNIYVLNTYNDRLFVFDMDDDNGFKIVEYIENELSYGSDIFDYSTINSLNDKLNFSPEVKSASKSKEKIMVSADGVTYVNKHGRWKEASSFNTQQVFLLSVFGGMFGAHLFHFKKKGKGFLYFITFGLFGMGWFFDSIEILFGIYKDPEGKYLLPLENKLIGLIMLLLGGAVFCLVGVIVMFLLSFFLQGFSNILGSIISKV